MRILLAEDDALLGDGLQSGLRQLGFQVDWVRTGDAAERELRSGAYGAAVLDLGLPNRDGLQVLAAVRSQGLDLPVLVLTARDAVPDRILGLDLGADITSALTSYMNQRVVVQVLESTNLKGYYDAIVRPVRNLGG